MLAASLGALALLPACGADTGPRPAFETDLASYAAVGFDALPGWRDDAVAEALPALRRSCRRLAGRAADKPTGPDAMDLTAGDWQAACGGVDALETGDHAAVRDFLERRFVPYRVTGLNSGNAKDSGKFTGYFEIELSGARQRNGSFAVPILGVPRDTATAKRTSRAEIEQQGDRWRKRSGAPVLFWAQDPVDVFFLHVQGSGRIKLADGDVVRIGYAGDNGHRFVPVGRLMRERGLLGPGKVTAQSVRAWLKAHPADAKKLMAENPRYIFFRIIGRDGPVGAEGVPLTPGRSLAVDPAYLPLGTPIWVDSFWPGRRDRPFRRLMVAQDTGAAIKGVHRGDVYWGTGEAALAQAGRMNEPGSYYVLLPRPAGRS